MLRDFKAFLLKENVFALAIAVVIGAAVGKVVTALVNDLIMPIIGAFAPAGAWRSMTVDVGPVRFLVGDFLSAVVDFVIIAFVVWRLSKALIRPDPKSPTRSCPYCRMSVDVAATRCPHCTSQIEGTPAAARA